MNKNFILGTAGHIDHGKTTLVKRLTGIDADRFAEEKKRGITIDLGFAYFDLPDGNRVGVVDVPGHERFVKNMLAGASGIDIVMFIVAADEGIMPQTLEHVDILNLLGVKKAIFVVTKIDLVDEEMLLLVEDEIETLIEDTIFQDSKIKFVSSSTGEGIDGLIEEIRNSFAQVSYEIEAKNPRLPIDRVFSVNGFGTVVTGTLIDGEISVGDVLYVYPNQIEVKVKNIQVHSENVAKAYHGQRVAINLQGIKREELKRGDVITISNALTNSMMIDAKIKLLERSPYELKNWTRLRLYHGTKEILCRLVLLDKEVLSPGEEAFVQLRLEDTISAKIDDNFVLRFYSPMVTVAGGVILDPVANKHKRFNESVLENLRIRDEEDIETITDKLILESSKNYEDVYEVLKKLGKMNSEIDDIVRNLDTVKKIGKNTYIHIDFIKDIEEEIAVFLNKYHAKNSLALGIQKEEFRQTFF